MGKDLIQTQIESDHVQTCLINQSEEKASEEAGLEGQTMDQLKENQPWSPPGELGLLPLCPKFHLWEYTLYLTLSQGCNMDPAPQLSSLICRYFLGPMPRICLD